MDIHGGFASLTFIVLQRGHKLDTCRDVSVYNGNMNTHHIFMKSGRGAKASVTK